jgi:predicted hydrocarbon binding protein
MVGLTRDALAALRSVLFRNAGANAAAYLQEAGYAGGQALFQAFSQWCASRQLVAPEAMTAPEFEQRSTEFFRELGWGAMSVTNPGDAVLMLDSPDWAEADPSSAMEYPGCYLTSGLLADFFGRVAGAPLAVMEVECRSMGSPRCRFLLGSAETMQYVYDGITTGISYETTLSKMP